MRDLRTDVCVRKDSARFHICHANTRERTTVIRHLSVCLPLSSKLRTTVPSRSSFWLLGPPPDTASKRSSMNRGAFLRGAAVGRSGSIRGSGSSSLRLVSEPLVAPGAAAPRGSAARHSRRLRRTQRRRTAADIFTQKKRSC